MMNAGAFRLHTKGGKRSVLCIASVILVFLTSVLAACSRVEQPSIGTRIDSPVSLASHPTLPVFYVLNAVLSGEYKSGSLQAYKVPSLATDSAAPLATLETPRLGTSLATSKAGDLLIAGFSGAGAEVRAFTINAQGLPVSSGRASDSLVIAGGRVGTIQIYPVGGQPSVWTVIVSVGDRTLESRIFVLKYSLATGFSKLAELPSDFYLPSRENVLGLYPISWGVPVVFAGQGIMVAFPQGSSGEVLSKNPTAVSWLQGSVSLPPESFDLRTVSALVLDLNALTAGQPVSGSVGFVPVFFDKNGQAADMSSVDFRIGFQASVAVDSQTSPCQLSGPFASLTQPAAVVSSYSNNPGIVAFSGWDTVATQLRSRLAAGEKQPVLGNVLVPSPVSVSSATTGRVTSIELINTGSICTLSWLRVEQGLSSLGREKSSIQIATDTNAAAQLSRPADLTGMAAFVVNGSSIMASSFSGNKIQVLRANGSALENVGVFSP